MMFGIQLALQFNMKEIMLESDCLGLIQELKRKEKHHTYFGQLVEDIVELCNCFNS